jgi:citrate lyase beta subunit
MKLKYIYQYISLNQDARKILQNLKKCRKSFIIPILDIEDSLQIPLDPVKSSNLKSRARETLKVVFCLAKEQELKLTISFRINALETMEFIHDIRMLQELNPLINWGSLFLPKVHSAEVLAEYIKALDGINYEELVIMAESKSFFDNYSEIFSLSKAKGIHKIHFGHWDYFYDIREFPIPLPDDRKLWDKVESMIKAIEAEGMSYIHTPFCFLLKHDDLKTIAAYLNRITTLPFGMTTLSFSQALEVCKTNKDMTPMVPVKYNFDLKEQVKIADGLVEFFNRPQSPEYSFNIDTSIYRFYAPHDYLNALEFLKCINTDGKH